MKKARPWDASFWSVGIPSLKIFTVAGAEMASPELSRTVTEISALSPRKRVPSLPLSWHKAGGGGKKRQGTKGSRNRRTRSGACSFGRHINARGEPDQE